MASGNGSGRMIELMGHAIARLDQVVDEQRKTNRTLERMAHRQDQMEERQGRMEERQGRMEERQDRMETMQAQMARDVSETRLHVAGIEETLRSVEGRLDSARTADTHMRARLTSLEGWARTQGYEGPPR